MICDVCGSNNYTEIGIIKNIWKNDKKVYQCINCGLYFIDQPTDEEIYLLYKNEYHNNIKNKLFEKAKSKMRYARSLSQFNFLNNNIDCTNKKVCEIAERQPARGLQNHESLPSGGVSLGLIECWCKLKNKNIRACFPMSVTPVHKH